MGDGGDCPLHGEKLTFCGPQIISKNKENIDAWVEEEEMGGGSEVMMRKGAVKRGMFFKKPSAKKSTPRYK